MKPNRLPTPIDVASLGEAFDQDAIGALAQVGRAAARQHVDVIDAIKALRQGYKQVRAHQTATEAIERAMPLIELVVKQQRSMTSVAAEAGISRERLKLLVHAALGAGKVQP